MDGLKESKQALGAEVIAGAQNFAPPTILAQASRLNFSTRLFNLIVTNVPGPQFPLYVLGREMLQAIPVAFLPENHALAIAIMSYNGQMNFGLLGRLRRAPGHRHDRREHRRGVADADRAGPRATGRSRERPARRPAQNPSANFASSLMRLRRPRGHEDHLARRRSDAFQLAHEFFDLFGHGGPDRAAGVVRVKVTWTSPPVSSTP